MNVGQVAELAGVSVRTLHHWDAVGLLVPSERTPSGYRSYDQADLERLRQVLTYRELGFGLDEIARLLDDPDVDALDHLRRQHELLADRIARLQDVAGLVRRAMEGMSMGIGLDPQEVKDVFGEHDPTQYAEEARQQWGDTDAYRQSAARTAAFTKQDWLEVKAQGEQVERRLADLLVGGVPADDAAAREAAEQHRSWIRRFYDCSYETHVSLAETYLADERFTAHYEAVAPGLAQYVHDAVQANAAAR